MKTYNIVEYWNERNDPCSKSIAELTPVHTKYLSKHIIGCDKILDFGPGYGRLFSIYENKDITAIDVTEQHKENLIKEAAKQNNKLTFICNKTKVNKIEFEDKHFDVAVVSEVLLHQPPQEIISLMKELLRVSKKVIIITYMNVKEKYENINNKVFDRRYCFNYNYYEICKLNDWVLYGEERFRNQLMFIYSDCFEFEYNGENIKFLFDSSDYYMSRVIKNKNTFYELPYLEYLNDNILNEKSKVVEVGAYLGNHTIYFSKIIGCDVISFEPTLNSYKVLNKNLELNNIDKATTVNKAISSICGKVKLEKINPDNPGANQYINSDAGIECCTLDTIINEKIDFIKIDVENMEDEVLNGCTNTINLYSPVIMIEIGKKNIKFMRKWIEDNKYEKIGIDVFKGNTWLLRKGAERND